MILRILLLFMVAALGACTAARDDGLFRTGDGRVVDTPPGACIPDPEVHRAASGCDDFRATGDAPIPELFEPQCSADADCTAGRNGRCTRYASYWYTRSMPSMRCTYDHCLSDEDCAAREACHCGGDVLGNVCVPAACKTDDDCPETGLCSPSSTYAGSHIETRYACRTCDDECLDDADCPPDRGERAQHCLFIEAKKHWACMHPLTAVE
jgi:hypothetical protein